MVVLDNEDSLTSSSFFSYQIIENAFAIICIVSGSLQNDSA